MTRTPARGRGRIYTTSISMRWTGRSNTMKYGLARTLAAVDGVLDHPVRIGRRVSISSTMKSNNADTRGVRRNSRVVSRRQIRDSSTTGPSTLHEIGLCVAKGQRQRPDADTRLDRVDQAENAAAACRHRRIRRDLVQPLGDAMLGHRVVEADQRMLAPGPRCLPVGRDARCRHGWRRPPRSSRRSCVPPVRRRRCRPSAARHPHRPG